MKRAVVIVAIAVVGLYVAWTVFGRKENGVNAASPPAAAAAERAVPVEVAAVRRGMMTRTLQVTGSLRSDEDVQIGSRISGKVVAVTVKEGDRVARGQLLVQLDEREILAQLQQARAAMQAARARYAQTRDGEQLRIAQTDAQVEQAKESLRAAKARLAQAETGSAMTDTQADAEVKRSEATLSSARANLAYVKRGARDQQRRMAAADVERAQSATLSAESAVRQAESGVRQSEVGVKDAEVTLRRAQALLKDGAISQSDYDLAEVKHENALAARESARAQLKSAQAQAEASKAQLKSAQENLSLTQEGPTTEEVRMAEEAVRQAEAALDVAKANTARKKVSQEDVEAARTAVRQAEESLKVAEANKVQYKLVKDDIAAARAAVAQAEAQVAFYEEQLRHTRIFSPVSGVVSQRSVNVGEMVAPGATLMHVVSLDTVYFEAIVPELDIPDVRSGLPVKVTVDALPNQTFAAVVRQIIPVAERESKQFRVRVSVDDRRGALPPGGFARGVIEVRSRFNILLVPKATLYTEAGETFVYLVADGRAKRQTVKVGLRDAQNAEILSGLQEGQQVVAGGFVTEGAKIKVVGSGF